MATLRTIRRRIASVKNTQTITKAMQMVSAAKLRKAQEKALKARPFAEATKHLVLEMCKGMTPEDHRSLFPARKRDVWESYWSPATKGCAGRLTTT